MDNLPGKQTSVWLDTTGETNFPAITQDATFDVAIIGGGIAGLSAAYCLKKAGKKVVVLESQRIVKGTTGYSTAKITSAHGLIYDYLIGKFGFKKARMYADANQFAVEMMASLMSDSKIEADFKRLPAYTYTIYREDVARIKKEVEAAKKLGLPVSYTKEIPLPYPTVAAIKYDDQARYHPRKYLIALAKIIDGEGSQIFENTKVNTIEEGNPTHIKTERGTITAKDVIIATNYPIYDPSGYFARLSARQSLTLGALLNEPVPQGMFYSLEKSFHSLRPQPYKDQELLLIGGEVFKTGQGDDIIKRYEKLIGWTKSHFDVKSIEYHWTTNDSESYDRVPLIGKLNPDARHIFVSSGFSGWGMTHGTVAGQILADYILEKDNPWMELYDPSRPSALMTKRSLLSNLNTFGQLIKGKLSRPEEKLELRNNEAKIISKGGKKIAVYMDENGKMHAVSAICTHMGCTVGWNNAEKTWDCPCHGSRFTLDGKVIHGPAVEDLEKKDLS